MPSYSRRVKIPGKSSQELYEAISQDIERFLSKAPIGKFDIERDPTKKELRIKSSMFSATLACVEAEMAVNAQLSLLAAPFRTKLDESITKWLEKKFNISIAV
jgi:hypothetical protein